MATSPRPSSAALTPPGIGVILAIDYGRKRLGLALSDEHGETARPYATWTRINRRRDLSRLRELVRLESVRRIVIGLPLHFDGTASEMSEEARGFARRVEKALGLPVEMMDERLSSWEAQEMLAAADSNEHKRRSTSGRGRTSKKKAFDDMAAAIILRDFLQRAGIGARD